MFDKNKSNNQSIIGNKNSQTQNIFHLDKCISPSVLIDVIDSLSKLEEYSNSEKPLGADTEAKIEHNFLIVHKEMLYELYTQEMDKLSEAYNIVGSRNNKSRTKVSKLVNRYYIKLKGEYKKEGLNEESIRKTKGDEILDKCIQFLVTQTEKNIHSSKLIAEDINPYCELIVYGVFVDCKVLFIPQKNN